VEVTYSEKRPEYASRGLKEIGDVGLEKIIGLAHNIFHWKFFFSSNFISTSFSFDFIYLFFL
jgi:hypothetical protein